MVLREVRLHSAAGGGCSGGNRPTPRCLQGFDRRLCRSVSGRDPARPGDVEHDGGQRRGDPVHQGSLLRAAEIGRAHV